MNNQLNPELIVSEVERNLEELENSFPVSAFEPPVQEYIKATNQYLKFPVDFMGASILFAASVAIGNTHKVKVMNSWIESAVLYIVSVGRPGTNKTHPLKKALEAILKRDKEQFKKFKKAKKEYEQALRQDQETPEKPVFKKIIVSDFTPEALAELHSFSLRGLGVYSDEINQWIKNFNRYTSGSAQEFWLSIFSGAQINIDRKNQDPILISEPFVSVSGSMQPGILHELQKDNRGQNGFIDRLLFAYPDNLKKEAWSETELPQRYIDNWERIVNNLLDLPLYFDADGEMKPKIIEFSSFAKDELKHWQKKNTDLINDECNDSLAGIYSKLEIYVIRFALILELLKGATEEQPEYKSYPNEEKLKWLYRQAVKLCHPDKNNNLNSEELTKELNNAYYGGNSHKVEEIYLQLIKPVIGLRSVEGAIKLVEYFRATAKRVNGILNNSPVEGLDTRKKEFYQKLPGTFTTDQAVKIAFNNEFPERTLKRFLNDFTFFEKLERGKYKKRY